MKKIAAPYIMPVTAPLIKNGIIYVDDDGTIKKIEARERLQEEAGVAYYNGILIPGFVNAYGSLQAGTLLAASKPASYADYLLNRQNAAKYPLEAETLQAWQHYMWQKGTQAIGNGCYGGGKVENGKIHYHQFQEIFDRSLEAIPEALQRNQQLLSAASITPYADFTVGNKMRKAILERAREHETPLALNNQRSPGENELYKRKTGQLFRSLRKGGFDFKTFAPTGKSSLYTALEHIPDEVPILLTHNTYSTAQEIQQAQMMGKRTTWVLCPFSDKAISGTTSDISAFYRNDANVAIGTGDAPNNQTFSILEILKYLAHSSPALTLEVLVRWATWNGAQALNMQRELGSLEPGKKPGLLLLENLNLEHLQLQEETRLQRLL